MLARATAAENWKGHSSSTCALYPKALWQNCSIQSKVEAGLVAIGPRSGGWIKYGPYNPFNLKKVSPWTHRQSNSQQSMHEHCM